MAGFQKENGVCHGRGFAGSDANGYLAKFMTWIVKAYADGGPLWYVWDDQSALATNPYVIVCDTLAPLVNDYNTGPGGLPPRFMKVGYLSAEAGYVRQQYYMWWDKVAHVGYGLWAGWRIPTYDDSDFEYRFRGGAELMVLQSRLGTAWYYSIQDELVGDTDMLEGADVVGVLQGAVVAGSSVVLPLAAGQATKFTADLPYYIYSFDGHSRVNFCKVTNVNVGTEQITVDALQNDFPAGAVIAAYAHRWYCSSNCNVKTTDLCERTSVIPYYSGDPGYVFHVQTGVIFGSVSLTYLSTVVEKGVPNSRGKYFSMRPVITEEYRPNYDPNWSWQGAILQMNDSYGIAKNLFVCGKDNMMQMQDTIEIDGRDWIKYDNSASSGSLILDTTSLV